MPDDKAILHSSVEDDILVLTVTVRQIEGEAIAMRLKEEMMETVHRHDLVKVILDLQDTRYLSSIAFWPLLALRKHLQARQGRLILCGLSGAVEDVFVSTKMVSSTGSADAPFEMAADRAAALARLHG